MCNIIAESQSWFMSWLGVLQHQAIVYLSQWWPTSMIIATLGLGLVILYSITYCPCKILGHFTFLFYFDQLASFNQPHMACPAVASIQCPKTTMNTLFSAANLALAEFPLTNALVENLPSRH